MTKMAMMTMMLLHVLMNKRHCLRMFKCASVKQKVERSCGFHLKCSETFQLQEII